MSFTSADALKLVRVNAAGTDIEVVPDITAPGDALVMDNANGLIQMQNRSGLISQADKHGVVQNVAHYDFDSSIVVGPGHDPTPTIFCHSPINRYWPLVKWDWLDENLPRGLRCDSLGGGYTKAPLGNMNMGFTTNGGIGDGFVLSGKNVYTAVGIRTQFYLTLNVDNDIGVDLQFGVQTPDKSKRIYMRIVSGPLAHVSEVVGYVQNGSLESYHRFPWASLMERREFLIYLPHGADNEPIKLCVADANNELDNPAFQVQFPLNDVAMPSSSALMIPFVQLTTSVAQPRQLVVGTADWYREW